MKKATYITLSIILSFSFFELLLYIPIYFGLVPVNPTLNFDVFGEQCAVYDSVMGYKWTSDSTVALRVVNGEIDYYSSFKGNNLGYISNKDYFPKKKNKKRIIAIGDSFSSGYFLSKNWADRLQEYFEMNGVNAEVYSFSIDGGGLLNWHQIFKNQIKDKFEFDHLVFAIYNRNLLRDFMVMHHTDTLAYLGYLNQSVSKEKFYNNSINEIHFADEIKTKEWINKQVKGIKNKERNYSFGKNLLTIVKYLSIKYENNLNSNVQKCIDVRDKELKTIYKERLTLIENIVNYCKSNHKSVTFALIPRKDILLNPEMDLKICQEKKIEKVSKYLGKNMFNGYLAYDTIPPENRNIYYFKYDGHWNQKGSDLFARQMYNYFKHNL